MADLTVTVTRVDRRTLAAMRHHLRGQRWANRRARWWLTVAKALIGVAHRANDLSDAAIRRHDLAAADSEQHNAAFREVML